jgi:hypothetical protein
MKNNNKTLLESNNNVILESNDNNNILESNNNNTLESNNSVLLESYESIILLLLLLFIGYNNINTGALTIMSIGILIVVFFNYNYLLKLL